MTRKSISFPFSGSENAGQTEEGINSSSKKQGTCSQAPDTTNRLVNKADTLSNPVDDFVGKIEHFPAVDDTYIVDPPELSRKFIKSESKIEYLETSCKRIESDYRNQYVNIKSENGGLRIIKTKVVDSWKGYYIIIDKFFIDGKSIDLDESKRIKIVFE